MMDIKQTPTVEMNLLSSLNESSATVNDIVDDVINEISSNASLNTGIIELKENSSQDKRLITDIMDGSDLNTALQYPNNEAVNGSCNEIANITEAISPIIFNMDPAVKNRVMENSNDIAGGKAKRRNVGDDLDILLSKINNIVDDCIDHIEEVDTTNNSELTEKQALDGFEEQKQQQQHHDNLHLNEETQSTNYDDLAIVNDLIITVGEEVEISENTEKKDHSKPSTPSENTELLILPPTTWEAEVEAKADNTVCGTFSNSHMYNEECCSMDETVEVLQECEMKSLTADQMLKPDETDIAQKIAEIVINDALEAALNSNNNTAAAFVEGEEENSKANTCISLNDDKESEMSKQVHQTDSNIALTCDNEIECRKEKQESSERTLMNIVEVENVSVVKERDVDGDDNAKKAINNDIKMTSDNVTDDDDVVFFANKTDQAIMPLELCDTVMTTNETEEKEASGNKVQSFDEFVDGAPTTKLNEDDVVLLLDDEEDKEVNKTDKNDTSNSNNSSKATNCNNNNNNNNNNDTQMECKSDNLALKEENPSEESSKIPMRTNQLQPDNSDNAQDVFNTSKTVNTTKSPDKGLVLVVMDDEEVNSNCSNSSNLLQEAKSVEPASEEPSSTTEVDNDNEEEEDNDNDNENDNDLEIIEAATEILEIDDKSQENANNEQSIKPSTSLLSEQASNSKKSVSATTSKQANNQSSSSVNVVVNRKRSSEALIADQEDETESTARKKFKSNDPENDDNNSNLANTNDAANCNQSLLKVKEPLSVGDTNTKSNNDIASALSCPSIAPYPPPKFVDGDSNNKQLRLDFMRRFRKSFDKMTKHDLEELILQKVVEAIIYKSEFAEMRELIEKQERIITTHRNKIGELSKQLRDLEMIHQRVIRDMQVHNSQFVTPVKVTRAVGLQVYLAGKKTVSETNSTPVAETNNASSDATPLPSTSAIAKSSGTGVSTRLSTTNNNNNNANNNKTLPTGTRRGCTQKITPIRPVTQNNTTAINISSGGGGGVGVATLSTPSNRNNNTSVPLPTQTRAASNRNTILISNNSGVINTVVNKIHQMPTAQQQQQQRLPNSLQVVRQNATTSFISQRSNVGSTNGTSVLSSKLLGPPNNVQRRSEPTVINTSVDGYLNSINHLTGTGNPLSLSITPAKAKDKSVIDLTEEDEIQLTTTPETPANIIQRRSLPISTVSINTNNTQGRTSMPVGRFLSATQTVGSKTRLPGLTREERNSSVTSSLTPSSNRSSILSTQLSTTNPRLKYNHPAPLPATPPQVFNPAWKLPPSRPIIRISNLDNGIVISWTMEGTSEHYDECVSYQIYAYQETTVVPTVESWRHVGDVKAMLLPMAVTLTQFQEGQRYYFAVRAMDCHHRYGPFSLPKTWG